MTRGGVAIFVAIALASGSLATFALGVAMQRAGIAAALERREATEAQRIRCRNGTYWPSVVRQGACSGRGGIAP